MGRISLALAATGLLSAAGADLARGDQASLWVTLWSALALGLALLAALREPQRGALAVAAVLVAGAQLWHAATLGVPWVAALGIGSGIVALRIARAGERPLVVGAWALWTAAPRLFAVAGAVDVARVAALAALGSLLVAVLLARRDPARHRALPYAALGMAGVAAVAERHVVVTSLAVSPDAVLALVAAIGLPLLSLSRARDGLRDAVAAGLVVATLALAGTALLVAKPYETDAVVAPHRAAELLLAGRHPYEAFEMTEALARFGLGEELATHYEDGRPLTSLNYPALSFLALAPPIALGLQDVRWVYLIELLVLGVVLFARLPCPAGLLALAALVANGLALRQFALAGTDPAWFLGVALAWLFLERRRLSPVALGLAMAARQQAWLFAPFYVLLIWRRDGPVEALRRLAVTALLFLAPQLPFLATAPGTVMASVLAPALEPLEAHGVGVIRLGMVDGAPPLPRVAYLAAALLAYVLLLALLVSRRVPERASLTLPLAPLFFAWRALVSYVAAVPLLAALADPGSGSNAADADAIEETSRGTDERRPRWRGHASPEPPTHASLWTRRPGGPEEERGMPVDKELLEILACPVDKEPVREEGDRLVCTKCGRRYPVRDGIPVMLVEEAEQPGA